MWIKDIFASGYDRHDYKSGRGDHGNHGDHRGHGRGGYGRGGYGRGDRGYYGGWDREESWRGWGGRGGC